MRKLIPLIVLAAGFFVSAVGGALSDEVPEQVSLEDGKVVSGLKTWLETLQAVAAGQGGGRKQQQCGGDQSLLGHGVLVVGPAAAACGRGCGLRGQSSARHWRRRAGRPGVSGAELGADWGAYRGTDWGARA